MLLETHPQLNGHADQTANLVNPSDIIDRMIDLRLQKAQLDQELQALRPAFFAACLAFGKETIELERAVIKRRFTPGKWSYDPEITEQEHFIKALKLQFQKDHEPISGRDITWIIQLLLAQN